MHSVGVTASATLVGSPPACFFALFRIAIDSSGETFAIPIAWMPPGRLKTPSTRRGSERCGCTASRYLCRYFSFRESELFTDPSSCFASEIADASWHPAPSTVNVRARPEEMAANVATMQQPPSQEGEPQPDGPATGALEPASDSGEQQPAITDPGKLLRIASMVRELLDETRQAATDEQGRKRLREIYDDTMGELKDVLSEDLRDELASLAPPLEGVPTESEIRIAQAQLVGWLEGLFHGIQAAMFAQQAAARAQFEELRRRGLPGGAPPQGQGPQAPNSVGPYL